MISLSPFKTSSSNILMLVVAPDPPEVCQSSDWLEASRNRTASSGAELGNRMHPYCRNALPLLEEIVRMHNPFLEDTSGLLGASFRVRGATTCAASN